MMTMVANNTESQEVRRRGSAQNPHPDFIQKPEVVRGETGWFLISEAAPGRWTAVAGPLSTRTDARVVQRRAKLCVEAHEWVVYSTAMQEGWLMVQCVECGAMG